MQHYTQCDDLPRWPLGSSIVAKFQDDGENSHFFAIAALIAVSEGLKESIENAAKKLAGDERIRSVQIYWPIQFITNEIFGQPIPKQYSTAIQELLNADFSEAIPDSLACDAFQRAHSLEVATWVSVGRNPLSDIGATVSLGCSTLIVDSSVVARSLESDTQVLAEINYR